MICDETLLEFVRTHFSVKNSGKAFAPAATRQFISDRKYVITPSGVFDFGLRDEIVKFLIESQITEIEYTDNFKKALEIGYDVNSYENSLEMAPRYFQEDSVKEAIQRGMGTILLATGAGKSFATALLIENYIRLINKKDFKCLVVVPGLSLVDQLQKDFDEYKVSFDYSGWTGSNELQDTSIVITNLENLGNRFLENPWILKVDMVIGDEAHRYVQSAPKSKDKKKSKEYTLPYTILQKIKTPHKFGFTGTLSDNDYDKWRTIGLFGPVLYEKNSKELRDEKFLCDASVKGIILKHKKPKKMIYRNEVDFLIHHQDRNQFICKLSKKLKGNTLILVNNIEHGENLLEILQRYTTHQSFFVQGSMEVDERSKIIKLMESTDGVITVAMSSIFSTGINVKNIHNIIFCAGGKSFIRIVQGIGRGLRLHESKDKLTIIDIHDNMTHSMKHAQERQRIYMEQEISYKENIYEI